MINLQIDPYELEPGHMGNCHLIPTLAALARKPEVVKKIFVSQGINSQGKHI